MPSLGHCAKFIIKKNTTARVRGLKAQTKAKLILLLPPQQQQVPSSTLQRKSPRVQSVEASVHNITLQILSGLPTKKIPLYRLQSWFLPMFTRVVLSRPDLALNRATPISVEVGVVRRRQRWRRKKEKKSLPPSFYAAEETPAADA